MDYKKLGERIRQARKAMHYSQEQLAGEIEYSVPHISHVENAKDYGVFEGLQYRRTEDYQPGRDGS